MLRLFRAIRVLKLVRKLASMRKILISLGACVTPVLSAFFMLFIMASVYAQVPPPAARCRRRRRATPPPTTAVIQPPSPRHYATST